MVFIPGDLWTKHQQNATTPPAPLRKEIKGMAAGAEGKKKCGKGSTRSPTILGEATPDGEGEENYVGRNEGVAAAHDI